MPNGLPYNYGPAGILLFVGMSLFHIEIAFLLWSIVQLLILCWVIQCLVSARYVARKDVLTWFCVFIPTTILAQDMLWGQINIVLMAPCLDGVLIAHDRAKPILTGSLVWVATAIKLTPGLFIIFFLISKRWKEAVWACLIGTAATLLAGIFFMEDFWRFFSDTLWNLSDRVALGENFDTLGNNSLQGTAAYLGITGWPVVVAVRVTAVAGLAAAVYINHRSGLLPAMLCIGLLSPLLSPISWIHHFVFMLPALAYLWSRIKP
ncbi:hypothetical protein GCM10009720_28830 [Yaniella flava]|uniref:DUF2029 domain-containing protein n=1 Tax=Yaniella flava TaxID=287930 RepID=A0ABN2V027_9MICC